MASVFSAGEISSKKEVLIDIHDQLTRDPRPDKVDLVYGVYKTEEGPTWVLPIVRRLERQMANEMTLNKDYLPALGYEPFYVASTRMLLGPDSPSLNEGRATGIQTMSGGGALRVGAETLVKLAHCKIIYVSNPTWDAYKTMCLTAGFESYRFYRYWSKERKTLDFEGMIEDLRHAPENSAVLLQACGHNPTGVEPNQDQWKQIADVMEERRLIPFFDVAYQGFSSGNLEKDAWPVRYFDSRALEMLCAQSYSKNFGLYSERVGNLVFVTRDASLVEAFRSHAFQVVRASYSHPPAHGAFIVTTTLNDPVLFDEWKDNIKTMHGRITSLRHGFRERLEKLGTPGSWNHITDQKGMFIYLGLESEFLEKLVKEHHIYLSTVGGRLNVSGLNSGNIDFVAECLHKVVTGT